MCKELKQKEVKKLINSEKVQVCAILETHLKTKSISKACEFVYGNWNWVSNVIHSPTCCSIVVGWDPSLMNVMVTHSCKQSMLCLIESVDRKVKFYCSFVYASNSGIERRELWSTLLQHKAIVDSHSWTLMGDFNVILKPEEQSNGPSGLTSDMSEFRDAVNSLEIDDLGSSGFNFTWTKSLKNPMTSTLKKLDRIMVNEEFIKVFGNAHGIFLPYLISDHSPSILIIPDGLQRKIALLDSQIMWLTKRIFWIL
ncbi:RNA-directed DNA polymerase, eukaryota, reverse transcriptase zinc-binding domain protein [Tanacetum coccineum]